ncbi:AMP-dependent synthetase/ligase [Streptomyces sp. NPDC057638]|uniref:AMP-dependent synthetase/ligase n=1 Tax=Streptomyces sp. NPDC057638 TaxID=3346190 RepID=UPI0036B24007
MREFTAPPLPVAPPVGGLADAVFARAETEPDRITLARKDDGGVWRDVSAARFRDEVLALAKGLLADGVRFGDRVALLCRTRYEWTLFDFALWTLGAQSVPLYPTSAPEQVRWMLQEAQVTAVLVEHEDHAMTVGSVLDQLPLLKRLWQLDSGAVERLVVSGARVADEVVHRQRRAVTPDSTATVIYTSGSLGHPRGCVLTHGQLMFQTDTVAARWGSVFRAPAGEEPSTLLFLPLAHVFGRMVEVAAIRAGVKLGHHPLLRAGSLLPDLAAFRPSFVLAVPYVFEKLFDSARRTAETEGRVASFEKAVDVAVRHAEARERRSLGRGAGPSPTLRVRHQFFERAVYARLRAAMGGRLRYAMSGGSGMDRTLGLFYEGAGISVYEGYGLTESAAAATGNPPERTKQGTVGPPIPGTAVRVADDGEVWLRGPHVFSGYLGDPAHTAAVLRDGWLVTGDLGFLDEDGYLTITGRKKDVLVTSGGKSVAPNALEERVRSHPLVAQCLVVGDGRPFVAALLTLDQEAVEHWLRMRERAPLPPAEAARDPELTAEVRRAVTAANTQVSQAESIRTFRVLDRPFREEEGLLTPSLKPRRDAITRAYAVEIDALYR